MPRTGTGTGTEATGDVADKVTDKHYLQREFEQLMRDPATMAFLDEGALDGLWYWDIEDPVHEWMSPGFWRTLGFDPAERKHLAAEWQDLIFAEDRDLALKNFQRHLADPSHPYDQLVRYRTAEGGTVTVRCRGKAIREHGVPRRMLGAHTVVHDTRQHEITQQLSEMLEMSGDAILAWSTDRGIQRWNRGATRLYGFAADEAEGRSPSRLLHPEYPQPWEEIEATLASGHEWSGEVVWTRKDGSKVPTSSRFQRLEVMSGDTMILQIDRDIAERRRAEERQALLARELNHRVKNLFAIIQSLVTMSARGARDVADVVDKIRGRIAALSTAHMASMTDEELAPVPLDEMVDSVLGPYRGERLNVEGPPIELPHRMVTPIGLTLHELATNAVKYGAWADADGADADGAGADGAGASDGASDAVRTDAGRVDLRWSRSDGKDGPFVEIEWRERCADGVGAPSDGSGDGSGHGSGNGSGFGMRLMQQSARQLDGTLERQWHGDGLEARLRFPIPTQSPPIDRGGEPLR